MTIYFLALGFYGDEFSFSLFEKFIKLSFCIVMHWIGWDYYSIISFSFLMILTGPVL